MQMLYRKNRIRRYLSMITLMFFWLGSGLVFTPPVITSQAEAAAVPFDQGAGYQAGAYDKNAVQPTATNWQRQSRYTGPTTPHVKWVYKLGRLRSTPVVGADGTIYALVPKKGLTAINPDGTLKWEFETLNEETWWSSPVIAADGTIYFVTTMPSGITGHVLYAVTPNGQKKWDLISATTGYNGSPAIAADGTIIYKAGETVFAVKPDRTIKWQFTGSNYACDPVIAKDGNVYVNGGENYLMAFGPDGVNKWNYTAGYLGSSVTISPNGNVVLAKNILNADGQLQATFLAGYYGYTAIAADGTIYSPNDTGTFAAFSPTGVVKWVKHGLMMSPTIGADGTIYTGANPTLLRAYNPDGNVQWDLELGRHGIVAPIAVGNNCLYLATGLTDTVGAIVAIANEGSIPVTGITLSPVGLNMAAWGRSLPLNATITPSEATNKGIIWTSTDPKVAVVSDTGMVMPQAPGSAAVTAKTVDGEYTASAVINVTDMGAIPVSQILLNQSALTLKEQGSSADLTATVLPSNATNKTVIWTSSDPAVAVVNDYGQVTPVKAGTATITASAANGGHKATCQVTVEQDARIPVTGVVLTPNEAVLKAQGNPITLAASAKPDNATEKGLVWTSSNTQVATVSANGEVTPLAAGATTITVKTNDGGFTATCQVTVQESGSGSGGNEVPATGVTTSRSTLTLAAGDATASLAAWVQPFTASNRTVEWTSSNSAVATVNAQGVVTPIAAGSATITVKTLDGSFQASVPVAVLGSPVPLSGIQAEQNQVMLSTTGAPTPLAISFTPNNATNTNLTFTSSNPKVVTVDNFGLLTPVGSGTAVITVKSTDGSFTTSSKVTVAPSSISYLDASEYKIGGKLGDNVPFKIYAVLNDGVAKDITTDPKTSYRSSSEQVVTVEPGVAHIQGSGSAEILVNYEGFSLQIPVTGQVQSNVRFLIPSTRYATLKVDEKAIVDLTAFFADGTTKNVTSIATWTTANSQVATINSGEIVAHSPGTTLITAWFGGVSVVIRVEVVPDGDEPDLMAISADARNVMFYKLGDEKEVKVFAHYQNGDVKQVTEDVEWHSQDAGVVDVGNDGVLTAIGPGTAVVIATYKGKSAEVRVWVKNKKIKRLTLNKTRLKLQSGSTMQLTLTATYDDNTKENVTNLATWLSLRSYLADVTNGLVTAVAPGRTSIQVKYMDKTLTVPVTVFNGITALNRSIPARLDALQQKAAAHPTP